MENFESYSWQVTTSNVDHPPMPAPPPTHQCVDQEVLTRVLSPRIFKTQMVQVEPKDHNLRRCGLKYV